MDKGAKVKYRGIQIGKVTDISYAGDQARLTLAINSDEMRFIPSNATVHIAGNTIFGAKSVEFIAPQAPSPTSLRPDAHVEASAVQLEVNTLFQSLIDLLHKIDPVELNGTLSALAEGLRGHGDDFGALLSGLNTLARQANPKLPALQEDFRKTGVVTNIYADAAPDLNTVFDNLPTINKTVVDEQNNLNDTLLATIGLANNAYETLEPAEQNFIDAINRLRAPLKVAADYSPEFGCLFAGIERGIKEFAPLLGVRKAGLFTSSSFVLGAPSYTYPESPADRQRLRRSELPRTARHPDQADRRVVLPGAVPGHRQRQHPVRAVHRIAVRRTLDAAVPVPRRLRGTGRLLMAAAGVPSHRSMLIKVSIFAVAMLLVAAGLVVVFGDFRFGAESTYHATFTDASRLKAGQKVRIAGVPVGAVSGVKLNPDNTIDVAFGVDRRYTLYSSTRAVIRYENLVGDRYLEITSGPGELRKLPPGGTINSQHTQPALDLDALLGGLRPVLKGLDADKVNTISSAVIELLQGQGGALSNVLSDTSAFSSALGQRDQLIGDVITNLNTVLGTIDQKSAQFSASVDQLQQLITGLAKNKDAIAGAIPPLASTTTDLTELLKNSRRPLQGILENTRPLATELDNRKAEVNNDVEQLGEDYLRLAALGAYGSFFNIYFCSVTIKINGPAGSDILLPLGGQVDPSKGRCAFVK